MLTPSEVFGNPPETAAAGLNALGKIATERPLHALGLTDDVLMTAVQC